MSEKDRKHSRKRKCLGLTLNPKKRYRFLSPDITSIGRERLNLEEVGVVQKKNQKPYLHVGIPRCRRKLDMMQGVRQRELPEIVGDRDCDAVEDDYDIQDLSQDEDLTTNQECANLTSERCPSENGAYSFQDEEVRIDHECAGLSSESSLSDSVSAVHSRTASVPIVNLAVSSSSSTTSVKLPCSVNAASSVSPDSSHNEDERTDPRCTSLPVSVENCPVKDGASQHSECGESLHILEKELVGKLPCILEKLRDADVLHEFVDFFRLVESNSYPLANISFLLWIETIKWFTVPSTTAMAYRESTTKFWQCGYAMFHGKFLRFMSGPKNLGQVVSGQSAKGDYSPKRSTINFAVPDATVLRQHIYHDVPVPRSIQPGIIGQSLDLVKECKMDVPQVLSVDGKKVASGLSEDSGDVDLFGHEDGVTLAHQKERLASDIGAVETLIMRHQQHPNGVPSPVPMQMLLKDVIYRLTMRIKDLREKKLKLEQGLKKFLALGGDEWQKSKYLFAISAAQCQLYQVNSTLQQALQCICNLIKLGSSNIGPRAQKSYSIPNSCSIPRHMIRNHVSLKSPGEWNVSPTAELTKQRTPEWMEIRKGVPVTGSTVFDAIGLNTLKDQKAHFDHKVRGMPPKQVTPEQEVYMAHGTKNEEHAITTLACRILPFFYPEYSYCEEGVHLITPAGASKPLVAVSPDGSIRRCNLLEKTVGLPLLGVEVKCPFPNTFKTPVHYKLPVRYVPQVLAEMAALGVSKLVYASYSDESTTVFEVTFNGAIWNDIMEAIGSLYGVECPRRPSSVSAKTKAIKESLERFVNENVCLLAEVPSVKCMESVESFRTTESSPYLFAWNSECETESPCYSTDKSVSILTDAKKIVNEGYQLCRLKGVELVVFMLSDINRSWHEEIPHSVPIAYGLKGYSLTSGAMRDLIETVLQACQEKGLDVPCVSFDGQWSSLMTRDKSGRPLTRLQLQKDIWCEAKSTSRPTILQHLKQIGQPSGVVVERGTSGIRISSSDPLTFSLSTPLNPVLWTTKVITAQPEEHNQVLSTSDAKTTVEATHANEILVSWQAIELEKGKKKWGNSVAKDIQDVFASAAKLSTLSVPELDVAMEITIPLHHMAIKKSWPKSQKINFLSKLFGDGSQVEIKTKQDLGNAKVCRLRDMCIRVLAGRSYPKPVLNAIFAQAVSQKREDLWFESGTVERTSTINGETNNNWYYQPELREGQLQVKVLDGHHLLVNLRVKVCKDGLSGYKIRKKAWHAVAEKSPKILSPALAIDLIDRQSGSFAKRTFSHDVEIEMRELGFEHEANFVGLVRNWYRAEDEPGISAPDRARMRLGLKEFLLQGVDFSIFPPPGSFINGMSVQMFEGFISSIDAHFQLYPICRTYNQRAVGSQDCEGFFSEITDLEPTKLGCPKAVNIGRLLSTATRLLQYRCNSSSRSFSMWTTKNPTYPSKPTEDNSSQDLLPLISTVKKIPDTIDTRDHYFDTEDRKRTRGKSKRGDVAPPHAPSRGVTGVRQFHKRDESKILPTTRLGLTAVFHSSTDQV